MLNNLVHNNNHMPQWYVERGYQQLKALHIATYSNLFLHDGIVSRHSVDCNLRNVKVVFVNLGEVADYHIGTREQVLQTTAGGRRGRVLTINEHL